MNQWLRSRVLEPEKNYGAVLKEKQQKTASHKSLIIIEKTGRDQQIYTKPVCHPTLSCLKKQIRDLSESPIEDLAGVLEPERIASYSIYKKGSKAELRNQKF